MSQTDLLILARQGNVEAIATLMNRKLAPVQVTVEAQLEGDCLRLQLVAHGTLPPQGTLVNFVGRGMEILKVNAIQSVQISGWQRGATQPDWVEWLGRDGETFVGNNASEGQAIAPKPPGQAFGVNIAALAAAAASVRQDAAIAPDSNGPTSSTLSTTPTLPVLNSSPPASPSPTLDSAPALDSSNIPAPPPSAPAVTWDGDRDPAQDYQTWMRQTEQLGWRYQHQIPNLAAFLVYFLNPAEVPIDVVGVRYGGQRGVLLLTDQRLSCLGTRGWRQTVQEYFSVPLVNLTPAHQSRVQVTAQGLQIDHPPQGLTLFLPWIQGALGERFVQRSLRNLLASVMVMDDRSTGLTVWDGGSGDRLPLLFYGFLCFAIVVVILLLVLTVP